MKNTIKSRLFNYLSTSANKATHPRGHFIGKFMVKTGGDFGKEIIDAFHKGQVDKFAELWDDVTKTMLRQCKKNSK